LTSFPDDGEFGPTGRSGFSLRAERLLVRVLLALRREARPSDRARSQQRAEELADLILTDFPRRVLPFGIAAIAIIAIVCSLPLLRDVAQGDAGIVAASPAVLTVESGIRQRGAAVGDGIDAIRTMVAPFASDSAGVDSAASDAVAAPPCDARAPFSKS
jgi:hypothetical protein